MPLGLGIVGTAWISDCFADACLSSGCYKLAAVCSRNTGRAKEFGEKYGAALCFDDISAMSAHPDVDVVYVASPNSSHYEHCIAALSMGKHVIVEKPAFSNLREAKSALDFAEKHNLMLFEAARHIHEPNHQAVKAKISEMESICGASLSYCQFSSRYDSFLKGQISNVFTLEHSGGALMDLGIYLVYAALDWFGAPESASYTCHKLSTGVDSGGVILLRYPDFCVDMTVSKLADGYAGCEIRGVRQTLILDAVHNIGSIRLVEKGEEPLELALPKRGNWMEEEAAAFARIIGGEGSRCSEYKLLKDLLIDVHSTMTSLRISAGIEFPADKAGLR